MQLSNLSNMDINWVCANAECLPFEDNKYTAYTIAFGIRNVTHIDKVRIINILNHYFID